MAHILVFAFDLTEASQIRRIQSFLTAGHTVTSASFRRTNMNVGFSPEWTNIDLGETQNARYGKRIMAIGRGLYLTWRNKNLLGDIDVIVARNFDLLVIAWLMRICIGNRAAPLVYECLDIHGLFTRAGFMGRAMRWAERRLLGQIQLLLVSSPGFIREYFEKVQAYDGPYTIIENKLWLEDISLPRPTHRPQRSPDTSLVVGWVGSIRCAPSLDILMQTADQMGSQVQVQIYGNVHTHALPDFDREVAARTNVTYFGSYTYPVDLARIYQACDLVWAQDLWQRGANSDWLLPNRIYEASWFGCPSVAVADTETGRRIVADGLGYTIAKPMAAALTDLLTVLQADDIAERANHILQINDHQFQLRPDDIANMLLPVLGSRAAD